ncbi:ABC transporter substrate-binding protein [Jiangella alkaliphila]|uniref:Carbohydrate ABC transporter substrate-binding protein, CUT1 family n=1 Tax=Jiangella alkaliphila TaxID=419479 RepID=A0A1H2IQQ6_9ACTN|nr:sugar ABC transporter substrate-binding protein [Jiangella alkaliphila]SDU46392.1 carbohydrate ABC transporter substrate-binding protein, CUT1 family [Jiangella alkaliphila]
MKHRVLTGIAGITAAALTLTACGGGDDGGDSTSDGPAALRMTVWTADEAQLALFQEIADAYVADHADTVSEISFETLPFEDYTTGITTQIAGGNPPDLAWIFESSAPEFVASGALLDLRPVLEETEGYDVDDLEPDALRLWENDGGLYAYPFSNSPFGVFVNTDQLTAAGQPLPADLIAAGDWTWDRAAEIAAATAQTSGKAGLVVRDFDFALWENLGTIWSSFGARPWSEDGSSCEFTSPEMIDALTWIHDQIFTTGAMPGPGTTADFFAGDAALTVTQISRASALDDSFGWDLVPLPDGPEGHVNVIGQAGIGVFADGPNAEVAADFLAYFTSPENAERLAAYFPPPRTSLLTAQTLQGANAKLTVEQLQAVVIDGIPGAVTKPAHANFAQLQQAIRAELDALWTADADVNAVAESVCAAAEPLLAG